MAEKTSNRCYVIFFPFSFFPHFFRSFYLGRPSVIQLEVFFQHVEDLIKICFQTLFMGSRRLNYRLLENIYVCSFWINLYFLADGFQRSL